MEAKIYACIDEKVAKRTLYQIKKRHRMTYITDEDILEKVNYSSPLNLQITTKKFSKDENEYISDAGWKVGPHDFTIQGIDTGTSNFIKGKDGSIIIVDILEIIPSQKKELFETKGKVISDFQDYLEKNWLIELKRKYEVKINKDVLHSLIQ